MNRQQILEYYSRKDIADSLIKSSKNREVAGAFWDGSYDKRPNILQFPTDVFQMAKNGVTSFHLSVEHWSNPMALRQDNYEKLRTGWDLIIDIDSKIGLQESKITADLICRLLKKNGVTFGIKFSGRRGFHICIPWESFPKEVDYKPLQKLYPDAARVLAAYIRKKIAKKLMKELVKSRGANELINSLAEPPSKLNPFYFVEVEKNWGVRHMFRAPYSLNEKTWLASLPLSHKDIMTFSESEAKPEKISTEAEFFISEENSAEALFLAAMDWRAMHKKVEKNETGKKPRIQWEKKISEDIFPPCIKLVLSGMQDGRKRSLFILINFLRMMNWKLEEIQEKVFKWNEKNKPPLPRNYLLAQLRYQEQHTAKPPANCSVAMYYKDIGICRPDNVCKGRTEKITIKNPVNYPFRIMGSRKKERVKPQGFSCLVCKKQFQTGQGLELHKGRMH